MCHQKQVLDPDQLIPNFEMTDGTASSLGCGFVEWSELPEVAHVHGGAMLHQQLCHLHAKILL